MKSKLYKHVTTNRKVSFIEAATIGKSEHPVMLTMSKSEWLDLDQPDTIIVEVSADE